MVKGRWFTIINCKGITTVESVSGVCTGRAVQPPFSRARDALAVELSNTANGCGRPGFVKDEWASSALNARTELLEWNPESGDFNTVTDPNDATWSLVWVDEN